MSTVQTERVLVVPTEEFHNIGYFQGFCPTVQPYLDGLLDVRHISYRPRGEMEQDASFKQLIPYVVFEHADANNNVSVFQYTRGQGQGEARLRSKLSVGIGGHISTLDHRHDHVETYAEGMRRELDEEVVIKTSYTERVAGMINDDETDVGKVHLGVVHVFEVAEPQVQPREEDIQNAGFRPVAELMNQLDRMESWSSICLQALYG
jgi:predicted NUDIX family phosphoesterase